MHKINIKIIKIKLNDDAETIIIKKSISKRFMKN